MPNLQWNLRFIKITNEEAAKLVEDDLIYKADDEADMYYPEDFVAMVYVEERLNELREKGFSLASHT